MQRVACNVRSGCWTQLCRALSQCRPHSKLDWDLAATPHASDYQPTADVAVKFIEKRVTRSGAVAKVQPNTSGLQENKTSRSMCGCCIYACMNGSAFGDMSDACQTPASCTVLSSADPYASCLLGMLYTHGEAWFASKETLVLRHFESNLACRNTVYKLQAPVRSLASLDELLQTRTESKKR